MGNPGKTAEKLEVAIAAARRLYDQGRPAIEDKDFDELVEDLRALDPSNPALMAIGHVQSRNKVKHSVPMLSLDKTKSVKDVLKWAVDVPDNLLIMPKYDGVAISAHYEGKLIRAVTRGDGTLGDDITHIAKYFLPSKVLVKSTKPIELRGEVLFSREVWEEVEDVFIKRAKGKGTVNARNAAAGSLLRKTITPEAKALSFVCYDVLGTSKDTLLEALHLLDDDVFRLAQISDAADLEFCIKQTLGRVLACNFPYETDGLVIKANHFDMREELGATSHHPKWAIALKHEDKPAETTVKDVEWQVSRTGTITPVAILNPVVVGGVTVARATLHHAKHMKDLKLCVGSAVRVTRRGGVIPHVEAVVFSPEHALKLSPPSKCPCCSAKAIMADDFLQCTNVDECPDVQRGKLVYWCAQTDMMGFGESVIYRLYEDGVVMQPSELYTLDKEEMKALFGKQLGPKLIKEASEKSKLTEVQLLNALGIDGIGKTQATRILEHFGSFENLILTHHNLKKPAVLAKTTAIEGIGEILAANLYTGIGENYSIITHLLAVVELITEQKSTVTVGPFAGKKVVFTGALADMPREVAQGQVCAFGGTTPGSLVKTTDFLVVGSRASPEQLHKRQKALDYNTKGGNIRIIEEDEFLEMLVEATNTTELEGE